MVLPPTMPRYGWGFADFRRSKAGLHRAKRAAPAFGQVVAQCGTEYRGIGGALVRCRLRCRFRVGINAKDCFFMCRVFDLLFFTYPKR
jgi:hypothetical protein